MTQSIFTYSSTSKFNNLTHRCYRWYRWRGDSDDCQHCYFGRRLPSRPWKISRNHRRCCRHRKCSWPIDRRIILQRWALEMVFCMSPFKWCIQLNTSDFHQYINIPLSAIAMVIVTFALPLKKVQGNSMDKIKQIDGWGCFISFAASIAILLPISWYVSVNKSVW